MTSPVRSIALFALLCAACAQGKPPFDADDLDTGDDKGDRITTRAIGKGSLVDSLVFEVDLPARSYVSYTFEGLRGRQVDIRLEASDGVSDAVLMLYGPQRSNGVWPRRLVLADEWYDQAETIERFRLPADGLYMIVVAEYERQGGQFELTGSGPGIRPRPVVEPLDYGQLADAIRNQAEEGSFEATPRVPLSALVDRSGRALVQARAEYRRLSEELDEYGVGLELLYFMRTRQPANPRVPNVAIVLYANGGDEGPVIVKAFSQEDTLILDGYAPSSSESIEWQN